MQLVLAGSWCFPGNVFNHAAPGPDSFKKMKRQAPHSKDHKLGVIVPFRDGCSAMSQVHPLAPAFSLRPCLVPLRSPPWPPSPPATLSSLSCASSTPARTCTCIHAHTRARTHTHTRTLLRHRKRQGGGRRQNLQEFLAHMPAFLDMVGVSSFRVIVVEQVAPPPHPLCTPACTPPFRRARQPARPCAILCG